MCLLSKESLFDGMAGWCSGAAGVVCLQPVDTILTRRQATGTAALVMDSIQARPALLWRGSLGMISAVPLQNALLMAGYGWGKRCSDNTKWGIFVGGCTGGVAQSFLMSPVELVKVHQQVHAQSSLSSIVQKTGVTRLQNYVSSPMAWKGLGATLLRDGLPHGIWFVSYEVCKEYMLSSNSDASSSSSPSNSNYYETFTVPLTSGAVAATVAWGVGYPADLIKTRIQASSLEKGIWATTRELWHEPGGGLYRGFGLKLVRAVPASMIGFCVYEQVSQHLFATFGGEN